jgi:hypothetical protein
MYEHLNSGAALGGANLAKDAARFRVWIAAPARHTICNGRNQPQSRFGQKETWIKR